MLVVHVLRHAKSSWADEDLPDHERPLTGRGRKAAAALARELPGLGVRPDLVLCSSALRARQTLDGVRPGLPPEAEVAVEDELYGATAEALLDRLRRVPAGVGAVLLIGHNPGLQRLVLELSDGTGRPVERARDDFPTAALVTLAADAREWSELRSGTARLSLYVVPRDLKG